MNKHTKFPVPLQPCYFYLTYSHGHKQVKVKKGRCGYSTRVTEDSGVLEC